MSKAWEVSVSHMPMRFPYLKAARVRLQERKNTCLRALYTNADLHVRHFLEFVKSDPILRTIYLELDAIIAQRFQSVDSFINIPHRRINLPDAEGDRAAFYLRLLQIFADPDPNSQIPGFNLIFAIGSSKYQDMTDEFFQQVLLPFYVYLDERIDHGDLILYYLVRYQRECSWFLQKQLVARYQDADSRKKEETVDTHLREWLFREGIDYPFSTPRSPSGRADIVVWHEDEPLPVEVKVFDGENRDAGHISQGLWQAFRYAADYGKPFGYLVIFNTTERLLKFAGETLGSDLSNALSVGDRLVFPIVVPVFPADATASKEAPRDVIHVTIPSQS